MQSAIPRPDFKTGRVSPDQIRAITGLDWMEKIRTMDLPAPSIAESMNFWLHEVAEGRVVFIGEPGPEHLNPMGMVHGGWAMSILDSALGCAMHTSAEPGYGFVTLDTHVKFVKPVHPGQGQFRATGVLQTRGRRICNAEGRLEDPTGRVVALATSTGQFIPLPQG